jgi:membrane-associated phospholipid phosphatase
MGSALYPRLSWFFWPLGVSIALARVVLNVHYVSDVLTGSLIGAAVAIMMKRRVTSDSNSPGPWPGDE